MSRRGVAGTSWPATGHPTSDRLGNVCNTANLSGHSPPTPDPRGLERGPGAQRRNPPRAPTPACAGQAGHEGGTGTPGRTDNRRGRSAPSVCPGSGDLAADRQCFSQRPASGEDRSRPGGLAGRGRAGLARRMSTTSLASTYRRQRPSGAVRLPRRPNSRATAALYLRADAGSATTSIATANVVALARRCAPPGRPGSFGRLFYRHVTAFDESLESYRDSYRTSGHPLSGALVSRPIDTCVSSQ